MNKITLGEKGDSSSIYEFISILEIKGCDGNIIYEIHDLDSVEGHEPNSEFINRNKTYYNTFIQPSFVDQWACNSISYAAKVDSIWYFLYDTGANTYLGTGPTSTINLRQFCLKKGIKILYIEDTFPAWIAKLGCESIDSTIDQIEKDDHTTISESYKKINEIIFQCGEGISQIVKTANNLIEENYRDLYLAAIRSHYPTLDVIAESTNRDAGRTDLKIIDRRKPEIPPYLYEFKVYGQKKDIVQGLQKIINRYPTLNNKYNGMVIINKRNGDISNLLNRIEKKYIKEISITDPEVIHETPYRMMINHKHSRNRKINCKLAIHVIDVYLN